MGFQLASEDIVDDHLLDVLWKTDSECRGGTKKKSYALDHSRKRTICFQIGHHFLPTVGLNHYSLTGPEQTGLPVRAHDFVKSSHIKCCYFILFYFIVFYFILSYSVLFYFSLSF